MTVAPSIGGTQDCSSSAACGEGQQNSADEITGRHMFPVEACASAACALYGSYLDNRIGVMKKKDILIRCME